MKNVKESVSSKNLNLSLSEKKEVLRRKFQKKLGTKEISIKSNGSLYICAKHILEDDDKRRSFRNNIRKQLNKHLDKIVSSGGINDNLMDDIKLFLDFYRENWLINDFKIESFTNSKKRLADKKELLSTAKEYIEAMK